MKANVIIEQENLKIIVRGKAFTFKDWEDFRFTVGMILTADQCNKMIYEENPQYQFSINVEKLEKFNLL